MGTCADPIFLEGHTVITALKLTNLGSTVWRQISSPLCLSLRVQAAVTPLLSNLGLGLGDPIFLLARPHGHNRAETHLSSLRGLSLLVQAAVTPLVLQFRFGPILLQGYMVTTLLALTDR